jgi:ABC-type branched-subunit amino acid transport system substrate-binding protein
LARAVLGGLAVLLAVGLLATVSGCGEEGAAADATVRVYVSVPLRGPEAQAGRRLCDEAREQAGQGKGGEGHQLRVVCLDASGDGGDWTLAQVGANARRATEDSSAVAYVGEPDAAAREQSRPIVEAAGIAELGGLSGREAVAKVAKAMEEGDASQPRDAVFDAYGR